MGRDHDTPSHTGATSPPAPAPDPSPWPEGADRIAPTEPFGPDVVDLYTHPHLYDAEHGGHDEDLRFYTRLARSHGGPVLELGSGTGRLTLPLAAVCDQVVALDLSRPMHRALAARLRTRPDLARSVSTLEADMTDLPFARERFPLVVFALNGFQHQDTLDEVRQVLAEARRVVVPGGTFAFDVYLPHPRLRHLHGSVEHDERTDLDGHPWRVAERLLVDHDAHRVITLSRWTDPRGEHAPVLTRVVQVLHPRQALLDLFEATGWQLTRDYQDFQGTPWRRSAVKWVATLRAV